MNIDIYDLWSDCTRPGDPRNEEALMRNYARYIRDVKRVIPKERMLVLEIEEGLGWEKICPYLDKEVPKDVAYPRVVEHEKMKEKFLKPILVQAALRLVLSMLLPLALGVGVWWRWFGV